MLAHLHGTPRCGARSGACALPWRGVLQLRAVLASCRRLRGSHGAWATQLQCAPPVSLRRSRTLASCMLPLPLPCSHLRDLLQDEERTDSLIREHNGLYVDFSRQNVTQTTLQVRSPGGQVPQPGNGLRTPRGAGPRPGMPQEADPAQLLLCAPLCAGPRRLHQAASSAARCCPVPPSFHGLPHRSTSSPPTPAPAPPPQLLLNLAERAKLRTKMNAMFAGEHINNTEDRAVLHTALRMPRDEQVSVPADAGRPPASLGVAGAGMEPSGSALATRAMLPGPLPALHHPAAGVCGGQGRGARRVGGAGQNPGLLG